MMLLVAFSKMRLIKARAEGDASDDGGWSRVTDEQSLSVADLQLLELLGLAL